MHSRTSKSQHLYFDPTYFCKNLILYIKSFDRSVVSNYAYFGCSVYSICICVSMTRRFFRTPNSLGPLLVRLTRQKQSFAHAKLLHPMLTVSDIHYSFIWLLIKLFWKYSWTVIENNFISHRFRDRLFFF